MSDIIINYIKTNQIFVLITDHLPDVEVIFEADISYNNLISSSNVSFEGGNNNSELIQNNNNNFKWIKTYNYNDYSNNIVYTETYTINFNDISNNISKSFTKTINILRYKYYILASIDLNNYIINDNQYYGLDNISLSLDLSNDDLSYNVSYYLPNNSKIINISDFIVGDICDNIIYDVMLDINVDSSGNVNSIVDISGESYTKYIEDNRDLSVLQFLHWPTEDISVNYSNYSDISLASLESKLTATITPAAVKLFYHDKISLIENHYSGSIINNLNIDISNILPSENNIIQQYIDNNNYYDIDTNPYIFDSGEIIAIELNNTYKVDIIDKNNIIQNIIPETKLYIFLKQI